MGRRQPAHIDSIDPETCAQRYGALELFAAFEKLPEIRALFTSSAAASPTDETMAGAPLPGKAGCSLAPPFLRDDPRRSSGVTADVPQG